ncbi:unnamed protein product, partial [marine sediment metagenome]
NWSYFAGTVQSMVFRPNLILEHPDWPFVGVSYAYRNQGAHTHYKHYYSWNELFEGVPGIEEQDLCPSKKYNYSATIFSGPLQLPVGKKCKVFDITGRQVESCIACVISKISFIPLESGSMVSIAYLQDKPSGTKECEGIYAVSG